jgi:hypothetical protein
MAGTTTGGLVGGDAGAGSGPSVTDTGAATDTPGSAAPPRVVLELEGGQTFEMTVQDLFMVSILVLLFADVVVGIAEVVAS